MSAERPILFSGPMVCAILAGEKTVTRRVVQEFPGALGLHRLTSGYAWNGSVDAPCVVHHDGIGVSVWPFRGARFAEGDRLWVRETWALLRDPGALQTWTLPTPERLPTPTDTNLGSVQTPIFRADGERHDVRDPNGLPMKWRPSIFMPRWASRITLAITSVSVERLHEITTEDVLREGVRIPLGEGDVPVVRITGKYPPTSYLPSGRGMRWTADELLRAEFASLWDTINGKRVPWSLNPWVWRVEFTRVEAPRGP